MIWSNIQPALHNSSSSRPAPCCLKVPVTVGGEWFADCLGFLMGHSLLCNCHVKKFFLVWWQHVGLCGIRTCGLTAVCFRCFCSSHIIRISLSCVMGCGHAPSPWSWTKATFLSFQFSLWLCIAFSGRRERVESMLPFCLFLSLSCMSTGGERWVLASFFQ